MSEARAPVEVYDPALAEASRAGSRDDEIALMARVTDPDALPPGVRIVSRLGTIVTLRATREQLKLLADCPAALDLEAPRRFAPPFPGTGAGDAASKSARVGSAATLAYAPRRPMMTGCLTSGGT